MFATRGLRIRILAPAGIVIILVFALSFGFILLRSRSQAIDGAEALLMATARQYARVVGSTLEPALYTAEANAALYAGVLKNPGRYTRLQLVDLLKENLSGDMYYGAWVVLERNRLDGRDAEFADHAMFTNSKGEFAPFWTKKDGAYTYTSITDYSDKAKPENEFYWLAKDSGKPAATNPYADPDAAGVLMTSLCAPIRNAGGEVVGVAGIDMVLVRLKSILNDVRPLGRGRVALIAANGTWVTHPDDARLAKDIGTNVSWRQVKETVQRGDVLFREEDSAILGEPAFRVVVPVTVGAAPQRWGLVVDAPVSVVMADVRDLLVISFSIALGMLVVLMSLLLLVVRQTVKPLVVIAERIRDAASQVDGASSQVAQASQGLAQGAGSQAAALEETTASLADLTRSSREVSGLTEGAAGLMNTNIELSGTALKNLVSLTASMEEIEKDSDRIGKIIKTIDEIAFQTNLLALNAAIEAARAGTAGAGFAVVADEVRSLAMRTTEAAHDTQELLDGTVSKVSGAARAIRSMNNQFSGIVESATIIGEKTAAITEASREQATRVAHIAGAAGEIERVTQQVAGTAEETSATAEELSAHASVLSEMAGNLTQIVLGQRTLEGEDGRDIPDR